MEKLSLIHYSVSFGHLAEFEFTINKFALDKHEWYLSNFP